MHWVCLVGLLAVSTATMAQHRCVENGKTVFTDRPCPTDTPANEQAPPRGNAPKVIGDSGNTAYGSPFGTWRGQIQYQAKGPSGINQEAMVVVAMTMDISPQGRILGSSPENGCRFRGIAIPGNVPTSIALDVTFAGCNFTGYNRRLLGTLSVNPTQKHAQFALSGSHVSPLAAINFFDIKGTLRR